MAIINPRIKVMEKMITSKFIDTIGKKHVFLSIDAAIEACRFSLHKSKQDDDSP
jgi:sulfate transporter 3